MAISLQKGCTGLLPFVDLSMSMTHLRSFWATRFTDGINSNGFTSAFPLQAKGRIRNDGDFIFYNDLQLSDLTVECTGDNSSGSGKDDNEALYAELGRIPVEVQSRVFGVIMSDAEVRHLNFDVAASAFMRAVDAYETLEFVRCGQSEETSIETAMILGKRYRKGAELKIRAGGQDFKGGWRPLGLDYGFNF